MTNFWFIRHGESESNAGIPVSNDATTPLTELGIQQANRVAAHLQEPPDRFVVSPFYRTQQTAAPTLLKFPDVPVETWPVHEFSYLSHEQSENTTLKDRRKLSTPYFLTGDPDLILGDGGESFNQFLARVDNSIARVQESQDKNIIIFGHGWFMRALLWKLYTGINTPLEKRALLQRMSPVIVPSRFTFWLYSQAAKYPGISQMMVFLLFSAVVRTPNCAILKFKTESERVDFVGYDISHLPKSLRGTTMINR